MIWKSFLFIGGNEYAKKEFEEMTNIPISTALYEVIEKEYMLFEGNKQTFCKAYKENANGLAERIATKEDTLIKEILLEADKQIQLLKEILLDADKQIQLLKQKISSLQEMNEKLARDLAQEQGWAPVTISNMSSDDYNELKSATHSAAMLPQQASDWISQCFGFNVHRIKILTEIPAYEKDRHGCLRKCGTEDREPFYYSTDWNYIAFTAAGLSYEIVNGDLYFYDGEV